MTSRKAPGPPVLEFLRTELASTPERQRAALRIVLAGLRDLAATLRMREESRMEPGAGSAAAHAERERILRLAGHVQAVFLALLVLARHRLTSGVADVPDHLVRAIDSVDRSLGEALTGLADAIEGRPTGPVPDLTGALHDLEQATRAALDGEGTGLLPEAAESADGLLALNREVVELMAHLEADMAAGALPATSERGTP
jgi:hypothetical protein